MKTVGQNYPINEFNLGDLCRLIKGHPKRDMWNEILEVVKPGERAVAKAKVIEGDRTGSVFLLRSETLEYLGGVEDRRCPEALPPTDGSVNIPLGG